MPAKLSADQLQTELATLKQWKLAGSQIERQLNFADFIEAMAFINKVAGLAEQAGHHPDIRVVYNRVTLALSTHDAGGLTEKDFKLAREIDKLL